MSSDPWKNDAVDPNMELAAARTLLYAERAKEPELGGLLRLKHPDEADDSSDYVLEEPKEGDASIIWIDCGPAALLISWNKVASNNQIHISVNPLGYEDDPANEIAALCVSIDDVLSAQVEAEDRA